MLINNFSSGHIPSLFIEFAWEGGGGATNVQAKPTPLVHTHTHTHTHTLHFRLLLLQPFTVFIACVPFVGVI